MASVACSTSQGTAPAVSAWSTPRVCSPRRPVRRNGHLRTCASGPGPAGPSRRRRRIVLERPRPYAPRPPRARRHARAGPPRQRESGRRRGRRGQRRSGGGPRRSGPARWRQGRVVRTADTTRSAGGDRSRSTGTAGSAARQRRSRGCSDQGWPGTHGCRRGRSGSRRSRPGPGPGVLRRAPGLHRRPSAEPWLGCSAAARRRLGPTRLSHRGRGPPGRRALRRRRRPGSATTRPQRAGVPMRLAMSGSACGSLARGEGTFGPPGEHADVAETPHRVEHSPGHHGESLAVAGVDQQLRGQLEVACLDLELGPSVRRVPVLQRISLGPRSRAPTR